MSHRTWQWTALAVLLIGAAAVRAQPKNEDEQADKENLGMHIGASESSTWSVHADRWGRSGAGNETTSDVVGDMEELKEQRLMAEEFEPSHVAAIDREMACAKVRLTIAQKREARNAFKKAGQKQQAAQLDKEIHALKGKLVAMEHRVALAGTLGSTANRE
jgi:superfamily II RNA helicase